MWGFPLILQIQEQILSAVENVFSHLDAGEVRDEFLYTSNENLPPIWPETYGNNLWNESSRLALLHSHYY